MSYDENTRQGQPTNGTPDAVRGNRLAPASTRRSREAGFTFLEIVIAAALMSVLTASVMPALQGYQTNAAVRAAALEAVVQFRQAQMMALAQGTQMNALFQPTADLPSRGDVQGWEICLPSASCGFSSTWSTTDQAFARAIVPLTVNMTAACYRGGFTPVGQYNPWTAVCGTVGATIEVACFNSIATHPYKIQIVLTVATERIQATTGTGTCP